MLPFYTLRRRPAATVHLASAVLFLTLGCGCRRVEPIEAYDIAKEDLPLAPRGATSRPGSEAGALEMRMLVAMVPHAAQVWFFKLTAPADRVAPHVEEFRQLIASLRFETKGPSWDLPSGWQEEVGTGMRYATLNAGGPGMDITVITLGAPQEVLANVNRWRRQLQLPPLSRDELSDAVEEIPVGGATATLIDLVGRGNLAATGRSSMNSQDLNRSAPRAVTSGDTTTAGPEFRYEIPEGWRTGRSGPMRKLALEVVDGDRRAELTVTALGRAGAALLPNVNRWRAQIGLPAVAKTELDGLLQEIDIDGQTATYLQLRGSQQGILAAILLRGQTAWFFKLMGDAQLVTRETENFESFTRSVRFAEATPASD